MKTLFIITGAVCSGKTTIANTISEKFNLPVFNEQTYGNLSNAINAVNSCNLDYAIFEHCDVLFNLDSLKKYTLKIFVLKLNDNLLKSNFEIRKNSGASGDYLKVDPIKQQNEILDLAKNFDIIEVNAINDYNLALNKISKSIELRLPKQAVSKQIKKDLSLKQTKQFKAKYFDYYDDVKSNTHEVYDW